MSLCNAGYRARLAGVSLVILLLFSPICSAKIYQIGSQTLSLRWEVTKNSIQLFGGWRSDGQKLFKHASTSPCWKLYFVDNPKTEVPSVLLSSLDKAQCKAHLQQTSQGKALKLYWEKMQLAGEPGLIDVTVRIESRDNEDLLYTFIEVSNRSSRCGIWEVLFPILDVEPLGSNETDRLVVPHAWGRDIPQPYKPAHVGFGMRAQWPYGMRYPGQHCMQFAALYAPGNKGLYWSTYDSQGYYKKFYYTSLPDQNRIELTAGHFPENTGQVAQGYRLPYAVVVGAFKGDWYDAAQIYRLWATKQRWASKGTLYERNEPTRWYNKVDLMCRQSTRIAEQTVERARAGALQVMPYFDPPIASQWYTHQTFDPETTVYKAVNGYPPLGGCDVHAGWMKLAKPGFAETVHELNRKGLYIFPLLPARLQDPGNPDYEESEPFAVLNRKGKRSIYDEELPLVEMCVATPYWQKRLAKLHQWLAAEYGVKGFYVDTLGLAPRIGRFCFDSSHGHPLGAGCWIAQGHRAIAKSIRKALTQIDPGIVLLGENSAEFMNDLLNGRFVSYIGGPFDAPIWQAVYAGYINSFCGTSLYPDQDEKLWTSMQMAASFIYGAQIGRLSFVRKTSLLNDPKATGQLSYLQKMVRYRKAARPYLVYGRLLRPLKLNGDNPILVSPVKIGLYAPTMPAVMHSSWQGADGSIGLFFTNADTKPHEISFILDKRYWNLETQPGNTLQQIDQTGKVVNETLLSDQPRFFKKSIAAKDVLLLRL